MAQLARIALDLEHRYPRPKVDPEWLQGCYDWLIAQPDAAGPTSQKFLDNVVVQLLQSDLTDSMVPGTGIPVGVTQPNSPQANSYLGGTPILVEIVAITEIGTSAYQLEQIRAAREQRLRLGQTDEGGDVEADLEVEGEGPVPKYPRGMLRFDLSDGSTTINAIEYRPIPELALAKTPLGFKMLLKNPVIRHGIAFLDQNSVELLGYQTADREALQKLEFARGLRVRMGLPLEPIPVPEDQDPQPVVQHARSPLREISPPPEPINPTYNDDANLEPRRRKVPSTSATQVSTASSSTLVPSTTSVSPYFSSSSNSTSTGLNGFNLNLTLAQASQAPQPPADDNDDDDDEALFSHFENIDLFVAAEENNENIPPPVSSSVVTSAASSSSNPTPFTSIAGPSSSSTKSKISPIPRPLVQEDSIEIVSFTPGLTQIIKGSQNKGKNKEKDPSPSSTNYNTRPNEDSIDLDPDIHTNLDEIQLASYSDPEFLRQQREELARHNASQTARVEKGKGKGRDVMMTMRPIKPLPRRSLSSQSQTTRDNNVIEIESDDDDGFFSDLSPPPPINPARRIPLFVDDSDDDEDVNYDDDDDDIYQDEDEYDKENMPVMTRHVKRKVTTTQGGEFTGGTNTRRDMVVREVIELSDED